MTFISLIQSHTSEIKKYIYFINERREHPKPKDAKTNVCPMNLLGLYKNTPKTAPDLCCTLTLVIIYHSGQPFASAHSRVSRWW